MKKLNVLFVYFIHGLGGENKDFINVKIRLEELFEKLFKDDENERDTKNIIQCYCSGSNSGMKSTFPLETMFDNDYQEYTQYFENTLVKGLKRDEEKYQKFEGVECNIYISLSGHSLGGNVARGTITKLYAPYVKEEATYNNFFEYIKATYPFVTDVKPCSYLSLSSPHMGSLIANANQTSPFIKKTEKRVVKTFMNVVVGEVGKELTFQDEKLKVKPVTDPNEPTSKYAVLNCCNQKAMEALARFPNRTLAAFLRYDLQVKYCTAMGCIETPLPTLLENEKQCLVPDNENDTRLVIISGYEEGEELEYYKKEVFNDRISKDFYYDTTKIESSPDIDGQLKRALLQKKEQEKAAQNTTTTTTTSTSETKEDTPETQATSTEETTLPENYEEMEDEFLVDNDNQAEIPVALIKRFNQIPFRRVSMDFVTPYGPLRMMTHGLCLDVDFIFARRACIRKMAEKTKSFYSHLLIADFIRTSEQTDTFSLLYLL